MAIDKQIEELILEAISGDTFLPLRELIENGLDIDEKFTDGDSILHKCFAERKYKLTQHLILLGANVFSLDKFSRTPLHLGIRSGFYEGCHLITLLTKEINHQDHKGRTPLMHAIKFKQMLLVKLLMLKSNTELKDTNGFASLMWAVKFLDPKELKELLESCDEQALTKQIEEAIEQQQEIEVSKESLDSLEPDDTDQTQEKVLLPNTVEEVLKKPETQELIASYSITEHLESLKEKAEQEGFDYEIATLTEDVPKEEVNVDYTRQQDSNDESEIIQTQGQKQESKNKEALAEDKIERPKMVETKLQKDEIQRVSSSDIEFLETDQIQRVSSSTPPESKEKFDPSKIDMDQYDIGPVQEIQRIKGSSSNQSDDEKLEVQSIASSNHTIDDTQLGVKDTLKNEPSETLDKIEEVSRVKSSGSINNDPETWTVKTSATSEEDFNESEVQKIKRISSNYKEEENDEIQKIKKLRDNSNEDETILLKKKEINYIKDGYRDEIKDELAEIKAVNKKLPEEEYAQISTVNKSLTEQPIAQIKSSNKEIQADYEIREIDPSKTSVPEQTNIQGSITNTENTVPRNTPQEETKFPPYERSQESKENSSKTDDLVSKVSSRKSPDINEGDSWTVQSITDAKINEEDDSYTIRSTSNSEDEDTEATQVIKSQPPEKEEVTTIKESPFSSTTQQEVEDKETLPADVDVNNKNNKGQTLCWIAAQKGQLDLLKKLIHKGADYEIKDTKGFSPLMVAAINGHSEVIDYLCEKVRNIDEKRTDGQTALTLAIEHDKAESARTLIDHGASPETKIKGSTLLMHAANFDSIECIKVLIMFGLDPMEKNFRSKTAMDIAKATKNKRAFMILKKIVQTRQAQQGDE